MSAGTFRRIRALTANTFVEALRQRFFAFLALLGAVLAASGSALRTFNFGSSELKFIADFGFGGMFFFGSTLAVVMTAQLFFSEMDNRTALTLLARPVRRWEFFFGKFLGTWALLGVFVALLAGILCVLLFSRSIEIAEQAAQMGNPAPYFSVPGLLSAAALQWLRLGVVAALTLFICSFACSFLYTVVVSTMALLACQLQGLARESLSRSDSAGWVQGVANVLGHLIPDLQVFDLGVPLALEANANGASAAALSALGYGLLYLPVLLLLSVWVFADREL